MVLHKSVKRIMMGRIAVAGATIINEGNRFQGTVIINRGIIEEIITGASTQLKGYNPEHTIDARGLLLIPGVIDEHVHFREPGLTSKGDIYSESKAAAAGGVTSIMDMPNTIPQTTTLELLDDKISTAAEKSLVNYSFYMGATNDNIEQLVKIDPLKVCGIKLFMGSSTGDMLVSNREALEKIFKLSPTIIVAHCEDEASIRQNAEKVKQEKGENIPFRFHSSIRSAEACMISSTLAVELAKKHGSRLHILHLSTARELSLMNNSIPLADKKITSEACIPHLWFSERDYDRLGWRIKCNPSIKLESDRQALLEGISSGLVDAVATDHAPHLAFEKDSTYFKSASGMPMVQHSLQVMLELSKKGYFSVEKVVEKMCHAPATIFRIDRRGYIRKGYHADLVLINPTSTETVTTQSLHYRCGWSPLEGEIFHNSIETTFINGHIVYHKGKFDETIKGEALSFTQNQLAYQG